MINNKSKQTNKCIKNYNFDYYINHIDKDWKELFIKNKDNISDILQKISDKKVYPKKKHIFRLFKYLSPKDIKCVILGQDPYINYELVEGKEIPQAEGFSFSVPKHHKKIPPSLKNIFKEIKNSYPDFKYKNGNLKKWVKKEKIFLLNSALTVLPGKSNSHSKLWQDFTDNVIEFISENNKDIIFILMGNNAKSKSKLICNKKHTILTSIHPSPLSASRGFFGCKIFENANKKLKDKNIKQISWNLA